MVRVWVGVIRRKQSLPLLFESGNQSKIENMEGKKEEEVRARILVMRRIAVPALASLTRRRKRRTLLGSEVPLED